MSAPVPTTGKKRGAEDSETDRPAQRSWQSPTGLSAPDAVLIHVLGNFLDLSSRAALNRTAQRHRSNGSQMELNAPIPHILNAVQARPLGVIRKLDLHLEYEAEELTRANSRLDPAQLHELYWVAGSLYIPVVLDRAIRLRTFFTDKYISSARFPSTLTSLTVAEMGTLDVVWPEGLTTLTLGRLSSTSKLSQQRFPPALTSLTIRAPGDRTLKESDFPPLPSTLTFLQIPQLVKMHNTKLKGWFPPLPHPIKTVRVVSRSVSSLEDPNKPWTLPEGVEDFELHAGQIWPLPSQLLTFPNSVRRLELHWENRLSQSDPKFKCPPQLDLLDICRAALFDCPELIRGCSIDTLRVESDQPPYIHRWSKFGAAKIRRLEIGVRMSEYCEDWPAGLEEVRLIGLYVDRDVVGNIPAHVRLEIDADCPARSFFPERHPAIVYY